MKKRILRVLLVLCMVLILLPTAVAAAAAEGDSTTFTPLEGTPGNSGESYTELLDGKKTDGVFSKWCLDMPDGGAYVIMEASDYVKVTGYTLYTGNDTEGQRNPTDWTLYGSNNYGTDDVQWHVIQSVSGDTNLPMANYKSHSYAVPDNAAYYKYYKLHITSVRSGNTLQLAELEFTTEQCTHSWGPETTASEATCYAPKYVKKTCSGTCGVTAVFAVGDKAEHNVVASQCTYCHRYNPVNVGDFIISGKNLTADDYEYEGNLLKIKTATAVEISNIDPTTATSNRIDVESENANITLAGVNIDVSSREYTCAFTVTDQCTGTVTITLADGTVNKLSSGRDYAGLQKNSSGSLLIQGDTLGTGGLAAHGGMDGAGIGGGNMGSASNITISGGTVTAQGNENGAGIGGGCGGAGSNITISGGTVTAQGGPEGAGIGGGFFADGSNIAISGGSVRAIAGRSANAIGGGCDGNGPVTPKNKVSDGEEVYLLTIANPDSKTVTIDGTEYTPVNHKAADSTDTNLYAYLTGEHHTVQVGDDIKCYHYVNDEFVQCQVTNTLTKDTEGHWNPCTEDTCTEKHSYAAHSGTDDGDCTTAVTCVCGYVLTAAEEAHSFAWTPSTQDEGKHNGSCQVDGCLQTDTGDCKDESTRDHKCDDCGAIISSCSGGTATCKEKAVCTYCRKPYGKLDSSTHAGGTEVRNAKDANCTEDGYTGDTYCKGCNTKLQDGKPVTKLGHTDANKDHICDVEACKATISTCSGGTATCKEKAVCEYCGEPYGEKNPENHTGQQDWIREETTHQKIWNCCNTPIAEEADHDWDEGVCRDCGYGCQHTGGQATCHTKAICEICGQPYGDFDPDHHDGGTELRNDKAATCTETGYTGDTHCKGCQVKLETGQKINALGHTGGQATCESPAVCQVCGNPYGEKDPENHTGAKQWTKTETTHMEAWSCCDLVTVEEEAHTFEKDVCTACGQEKQCAGSHYSDLDAESWYHDDVDYVIEQGLMIGYKDGTFKPCEEMTRAELVQVLYNWAGKPDVSITRQFSDVEETNWYARAVSWAVEQGIVKGMGDGTFAPDRAVTREELAAMLYRKAGEPETEGTLDQFSDSADAMNYAVPALKWAVEQGILKGDKKNEAGQILLRPKDGAKRCEVAAMLHRYIG